MWTALSTDKTVIIDAVSGSDCLFKEPQKFYIDMWRIQRRGRVATRPACQSRKVHKSRILPQSDKGTSAPPPFIFSQTVQFSILEKNTQQRQLYASNSKKWQRAAPRTGLGIRKVIVEHRAYLVQQPFRRLWPECLQNLRLRVAKETTVLSALAINRVVGHIRSNQMNH